ncbi:MAG: hypothetical protein JWQ14_2551 [Adhaeribacter sp.]|nr:hypothetical protein [Adhaeribacter sp.]
MMYSLAFFALFLILMVGLAKWYYSRHIVLFRSGDLIQERRLFGGIRSGTLSKFDDNNLFYIPDNGFDLVQRKWYWFFLINNISFNERAK